MQNRPPIIPRFEGDGDLYPEHTPHKDKIESLYPLDPAFVHAELRSITSRVPITLVCFSNRSGSNLLLDILSRLDCGCELGDEFFNGDTVLDFHREFGFASFEDYLCFVLKSRLKPNGIFLKVGPHQLFWLANAGLINKYFFNAKYIVSERRDKLAQAVSLYIARKTGVYFHVDGPVKHQEMDLDSRAMLQALWHVCNCDFLFQYFLAIHAKAALHVVYEDLESDPAGVISAVAEHCAFALPPGWQEQANLAHAKLKRQRGPVNETLARQFAERFSLGDPFVGSVS